MTVPAPVSVIVAPLIVAGPDTIAKVGDNPELAVALTEKAESPYVLLASAPNVIVWFALATVIIKSTVVGPLLFEAVTV